MKIYCVVQRYYDDGTIKVAIEKSERDDKPENTSQSLEKLDIYRDYFTDQAEADQFYKESLKA